MFRHWLGPLLLFLLHGLAWAHPVAPGRMELVIHEDHLLVRARVSVEQAFVADALDVAAEVSGGLEALWVRHGKYLLAHLFVSAESQALQGEILQTIPPETTRPEGRIGYDVRFPFPAGSPRPAQIELRQNVLNEIEFALGNRWEATYVTLIRQGDSEPAPGEPFTSRAPLTLTPDWRAESQAPGAAVAHAPTAARSFRGYLWVGVMHILTGYDHLLFVAALVLATLSFWDLVKVVTAFTLAHTITLTLLVLQLVPSGALVEPMIAASIVVVALQNIFWPRQARGWSRLLVAFGFGLFHGLGFGGALLVDMGQLQGHAVAWAIVAFSLGVELGHQFVILPLFGLLGLTQRKTTDAPGGFNPARLRALRYGSVLICAGGLVYLAAALGRLR